MQMKGKSFPVAFFLAIWTRFVSFVEPHGNKSLFSFQDYAILVFDILL